MINYYFLICCKIHCKKKNTRMKVYVYGIYTARVNSISIDTEARSLTLHPIVHPA